MAPCGTRVAVTFAIDGDLRFISHLDTMRLFARAMARAHLPVKYSQGFNPQPKLRLLLPRPVGVASDQEVLVIELTEPVDPDAARQRLGSQLPDGIILSDVRPWLEAKRPHVSEAVYRVDIDASERDRLAKAAEHFLQAESWPVVRRNRPAKPAKTVDIRKSIIQIRVHDDCLEFTLAVRQEGSTARPIELLEAIGLNPEQVAHRIRRTRIVWA